MLSALDWLETEANCNGICEEGNFFFSKSLREGPPKQSCAHILNNILDKSALAPGAAIITTFLMLLLTSLSQFWICVANSRDLEKKRKNTELTYEFGENG